MSVKSCTVVSVPWRHYRPALALYVGYRSQHVVILNRGHEIKTSICFMFGFDTFGWLDASTIQVAIWAMLTNGNPLGAWLPGYAISGLSSRQIMVTWGKIAVSNSGLFSRQKGNISCINLNTMVKKENKNNNVSQNH